MQALFGCLILAGSQWLDGMAVLIDGPLISHIVPMAEVPPQADALDLCGGYLVPGFIDLQVNGGGGVLFNHDPSVETIAKIATAHRRFGTTGLLPTLISDMPDVIHKAVRAIDDAVRLGVPGILGIHIEGPVLNEKKKGVHDARRFRSLDPGLIDLLSSLEHGKTLVTLAPEQAAPEDIEALVARGVRVWAGHTNGGFDTVRRAIDAGLTGFTHLYNAMSPLMSRSPGAVGAALDSDDTYVGIIADGFHVHEAALRIALRCKGVDRTVLVTDAMPSVGAPNGYEDFDLFGQWVDASGPRLTIEAGNLAGSALSMIDAVTYARKHLGVSRADALRMASSVPARAIGINGERGMIAAGWISDLVHISEDDRVTRTWINGEMQAHALEVEDSMESAAGP